MTVSIVSGIQVFAGPLDIVTSIQAPNIPGGGAIGIGDVVGLQAALDSKLDDVLTTLGITNITATGAELNLLAGLTVNVQTELDSKVDILGDTMTGDLIMSGAVIQLDPAAPFGAPALTFTGDLTTGMWWPGAGTIGFSVGGLDAFHILPSGLLQSQVATYETLVLADDDIPNKKYVDDAITTATGGPFLPLAGGVMTGDIDLDGVARLRLDADGDSFWEAFANDIVNLWIGGAIEFVFDATCLDVGTKTIKNVVNPVNPQDAATMDYVDTEIVALNLTGTGPYLRLSGADTMLGQLDMGGFDIVNQLDPTNPQDGATKNYVDTEIVALGLTGSGPYLPLAGGTMTGAGPIDMGGAAIQNMLDPVNPQDAVTLLYAQNNFISTTGAAGPLGGNLDAGGFRIVNLANPVGAQDAATKDYVDTNFLDLLGTSAMQGGIDMGGFGISNVLAATANDEAVNLGQGNSLWLRLDGSSAMTGGLDMNGNAISNVTAATANDEAVNLGQADGRYLQLTGASAMTGALDMGAQQINNLLNPTIAQDAATKDYVDTEITSLSLGTTFLALAGGTMTGNLITGGGVQVSADPGLLAAPSYAFTGALDSGMFWDGTNLRFSVDATPAMTIGPSTGTNDVDVHGRLIKNAADPVVASDVATKGFVDNQAFVKLLGSVSGVDLLTLATTPIYTVPAGKMHIVTQIIVRATSYTPGAGPTNPDVSVGLTGGFNEIIDDNTVLDWGGAAGASDQAVYLQPIDGSPTPNAGAVVRFQVDTAGGGTFSALAATVYVLGIEL